MAKYIISKIKREETNPSFDPERGGQNDGGNYSQPRYTIRFADGTKVIIEDDQCGDFGGSISVKIIHNRRRESAQYVTNDYWADSQYSTIPVYWVPYIKAVQWALGDKYTGPAYMGIPFRGDFDF